MAKPHRADALSGSLAGLSDLTLGTAQLGLAYGPKAEMGVMPADRAADILSTAAACGVTCLDTAAAYGEAEDRIGGWCRSRDEWPLVVTKLPALTDGADPVRAINDSLQRSLTALDRAQVDGYLVHRASDLARDGVAAFLRAESQGGRIGAFGVSVYTPEEADAALAVAGLSLVQAPVSLVNQTMIDSGALARAADAGCTVFARSVLAQGLMLASVDGLPTHFLAAKPVLGRLHGLAEEAGCGLLALALAAVSRRAEIDSLVIGCDDAAQLEAVAAAMGTAVAPEVVDAALALARGLPAAVFDPRFWPKFGSGADRC